MMSFFSSPSYQTYIYDNVRHHTSSNSIQITLIFINFKIIFIKITIFIQLVENHSNEKIETFYFSERKRLT